MVLTSIPWLENVPHPAPQNLLEEGTVQLLNRQAQWSEVNSEKLCIAVQQGGDYLPEVNSEKLGTSGRNLATYILGITKASPDIEVQKEFLIGKTR